MPFRIPPIDEKETLNYDDFSSEEEDDLGGMMSVSEKARMFDRQSRAADQLSIRLLQVHDEEEEARILRETLHLTTRQFSSRGSISATTTTTPEETARKRLLSMLSMAVVTIVLVGALTFLGISYCRSSQ